MKLRNIVPWIVLGLTASLLTSGCDSRDEDVEGLPGPPGADVRVDVTSLDAGHPDCPYGGFRMDFYTGEGDEREVMATETLCNGSPGDMAGPTGPQGPQGPEGPVGPAGALARKADLSRREARIEILPGLTGSAVARCDTADQLVIHGGCAASPMWRAQLLGTRAVDAADTTRAAGFRCDYRNTSSESALEAIAEVYCVKPTE